MEKWRKRLLVGITAGLLALISLPALAEFYNPCFNRGEYNHERRMHRGWRHGVLTPQEYARLRHREALIRLTEQRMMSDGYLSPHERIRLHRMQYNYNRDLYRYQHN